MEGWNGKKSGVLDAGHSRFIFTAGADAASSGGGVIGAQKHLAGAVGGSGAGVNKSGFGVGSAKATRCGNWLGKAATVFQRFGALLFTGWDGRQRWNIICRAAAI